MLEQQPTLVQVSPPPPEVGDEPQHEFFAILSESHFSRARKLRATRVDQRKKFSGHSVAGVGDTPKGDKRIF